MGGGGAAEVEKEAQFSRPRACHSELIGEKPFWAVIGWGVCTACFGAREKDARDWLVGFGWVAVGGAGVEIRFTLRSQFWVKLSQSNRCLFWRKKSEVISCMYFGRCSTFYSRVCLAGQIRWENLSC